MNAVVKPQPQNEAPATHVDLTVPTETGRLLTKAQFAIDVAHSFDVPYSAEMYQAVTAQLRESKQDAKALDELRKQITRPLDDLKTKTIAYYQPSVNNFLNSVTFYTGLLNKWDDEIEAKRKAEQARLDAIAAEERRKKEEAARKAEEAARAKADEMRKQAEIAAAEGDTKAAEKLQARAESTEAKGQDKAEDLRATADMTAAPVVVAAAPAVKGVSKRKTYSANVVDLMALVKAVAAGQQPIECLQANQTFLNQQAKAFKENLNIPGVELDGKTSRAMRG